MKVARTSPCLAMSVERQDARRRGGRRGPRKATAVRSSFSVPARPQRTTMTTNVAATIFSWTAQAAHRRERLARRGRRLGRRLHFGREDLVDEERQDREADERRRRRRRRATSRRRSGSPSDLPISAPSGLPAIAVSQSADESVRVAIAAEHQVRAHLLARRLVGLRAAALGERERQRVEHARAGRVAREGRRDDGVEEEDAVAQAERRTAEEAHDEVAEPLRRARTSRSARATRKATTMRRIVPFANPE